MAKRKATKTKSPPVKAKKTGDKADKGDTVDKILTFLFEMNDAGTEDVKEAQVLMQTGYTRTDSTGYRNAMKKAIKELGFVERNGKTKTMRLTETGMSHMQAKVGTGTIIKPTTNKELEDAFKARIIKFSRGKAPQKALNDIWDVLSDMKVHERDELLQAAGYKRPDSTGYREIMKWMTKLELIVKPTKGSFQFVVKTISPFDE